MLGRPWERGQDGGDLMVVDGGCGRSGFVVMGKKAATGIVNITLDEDRQVKKKRKQTTSISQSKIHKLSK